MKTDVTVCIPSIPPRGPLLERAVASVIRQTHPARAISIAIDIEKRGAAATRNHALFAAKTEWIAFLDDDDELKPNHLADLVTCAITRDADIVHPWFDVVGGSDPFPPEFEGREFNPDDPHMFPITTLVRRSLAFQVGGFPVTSDSQNTVGAGEDWLFWLKLRNVGARFAHLNARTWLWHHDSVNTGGLPSRW